MIMEVRILLVLIAAISVVSTEVTPKRVLRVFAVATESTDGFERFNRSLHVYGIKVDILGWGQEWRGGDVTRLPGGGQKINLLKDALRTLKDDDKTIILFTDSYDVVFTSGSKDILEVFDGFKADVVFSAEEFCWPDESLAVKYPRPEESGKRFLNSGGFIGYASTVYDMITSSEIKDDEDDQLFFTKIYLNESLRLLYGLTLDRQSKLFQNLNGAFGEVQLKFLKDDTKLENIVTHSTPIVIHGNGASKLHLNGIGNYLAKSWVKGGGCQDCLTLIKTNQDITYDHLIIGLFIEVPTPFLSEFFEDILKLDVDRRKTSLVIHCPVKYHESHVKDFMKKNLVNFRSIKVLDSSLPEWQGRSMSMEECLMDKCDYYMSVDSTARLTNPGVIKDLIRQRRKVIAPLLSRPTKLWSNFWGSLSYEGYYARSFDYVDIVTNERRGVWNVPHVSQAYLIGGDVIGLMTGNGKIRGPSFSVGFLDPEMSFSKSLRDSTFLFVSNMDDYGHLVDHEHFDVTRRHPDLYQLYRNQLDWERRYINPDYWNLLTNSTAIEQPCPDVFWFPVVTEKFTQDLIDVMESFGKWSSGTNSDDRLATGYENVPTRDIHMNQVGLEADWLFFLREYIRPIQEKVFTGYFHDPPKAIMNFVVRYRPDEQPSLRPHHDSSTYTINIALNTPDVDYVGGGCRFLRYDCSVTKLRKGWTLMHPGRLTHYHEGLPVTNGTRYIMVSFVDP